MRRASFCGVVLSLAAGMAYVPVPAAMQVSDASRLEVQTVNGQEVVAREALVRFRRRPAPAVVSEVLAQADAEVIDSIGSTGLRRLRSRSMNAAALVTLLARRGDVLYAEPNYVVRTFAVPSDTRFPELWGLEDIGQAINGGFPGSPGSDIRAVPAWDVSVGSAAHVVAVIDSGIDYRHFDLAPNVWSAPAPFTVDLGEGRTIQCGAGTHGFNAMTQACDPVDDNGHGTHVSGTIGAAGHNGMGVVGVNWTTRLMAIKFVDATGAGSIAAAIDGIRFAVGAKRAFPSAANVRVISASWGGTSFSQALLDEINAVAAEEMLFVAAAGNSGLNNDSFPTYPASFDAPNVVSVAATDNADQRAWFSNYGRTTVDLGAPGVDILSTRPGDAYGFASGTSMATPHVSGAAALVLSRCILDTAALKDALIGSVQGMEALSSTTVTGGRLDVQSALHTCIAPPPAPANLRARGADMQVRLSWSSALGATAYTVKRSLTTAGPYTTVASDVKGPRYTDTAVVNGMTYYYVISASNPLGESGDSQEASATPNPPSDLVVSSISAPGPAGAGSTIEVSATTTNQGVGPAGPTTTRVYLSANGLLDSNDLRFEPAHAVPALHPGTASSVSLSLMIPPDTPPGLRYLIALADADGDAIESHENNNTRVRSVSIGPDLTITSLTAPASAAPGDAVAVSETVKNQGGDSAGASSTSFYFSTNASLDASDRLLASTRSVPALQPEAISSGTSTVTIPSDTAVGTYYLIAKADGGDAVPEASETNNTSVRSIRIGADLVVSAFTVPSAGGAGSSIQVTETTANQGAADADGSVTRFYLSSNTQLDSTDVELGGRAVPALDAGGSNSGPTTLVIPSGTANGTYYLLAVADADSTVGETNESNNRYSRSFQIGGDLRVTALVVPASASPGSGVVVSDTTTNQGGGAVAVSTTHYYFSDNLSFDTQDALVGTRQVSALDAGASHSGSATVTIPASVTAGTYYIIAKADGGDVVVETQESNNQYVRSIQVGGDLVVTALTAPSKGDGGLAIVVTETTSNQGTANVPASVTRFYLSSNASLDAGDTLFAASRAVPALAAGAGSSGSTTLTIPATVTTGTYYVIAKADADEAIVETLDSNNTAARSLLIGPDLTVSALTVPSNLAAGSTFSATDTATNQGGGSAPASVTRYFLSVNASLDSGDTPLDGSRTVGQLPAGASSSGSASVMVPANALPGTYYVIAVGDADGTVVESSEGNNTRVRSTRIGPDLAVSSASLSPTTVGAGSTIAVTDMVVNQGAGLAAGSTTRFYLSLNGTLDASDIELAEGRAVPSLAAAAVSAGSTTITIPSGTAPGTYYVIARADGDDVAVESVETNNTRVVRSIQVMAP